ncbi:RCC1 domain-containing protein [Polyangium aurulentum]|uniref:RCC1 domain-containing protein n=1 Tax=Polyangium aurulentum TaxID=2567896 RepID=UPI00146F8B6B|nr:hypothetical protein [Polyangium aurulentum]UQA62196.1 hypothetical protein E8A73_017700 [Polyangium aurulentum]
MPLVTFACGLRTSSPENGKAEAALSCTQALDCPPSNDPCVVSTCFEGACMMVQAAANTIVPQQKAGDCRMAVCDGNGGMVEIEDELDLPADDGNECTEAACAEGSGKHAPRALGETCGKGGVCNGRGKCGACLPGKQRCEGNALAVCGGEGEWSRASCPAQKPVCNRAACVGVAQFALGGAHSCARLEDGTARCFGAEGRLGDDGVLVHVTALLGAHDVALGEAHSCALGGGGVVACWGANTFGQLGDGGTESRSAPTAVPGLAGATRIAAGAEHTCALLSGGEVKCWGRNDLGQLGDGAQPKRPAAKRSNVASVVSTSSGGAPVVVAGLEDALRVALGGRHACALRLGGRVVCWGEDEAGQLGGGGHSPPAKPGARPPPPPKLAAVTGVKGAKDLALGAHFGCALLGDGTARCWGANGAGQLGDGTTVHRPAPVVVAGLSGVTAIALGAEHGCAIVEGGAVRCWGKNDRGQLGDGTREPRSAPVSVVGLSGVRAIAAGGGHTCAALGDGTLQCWGENGSGEVGDGTSEDRADPVPVAW